MGGYQDYDVTSCDVKYGCWAIIEFLRYEGIKQGEIVETLQKVYRDKSLSQLTVCQWLDILKSSNLDDDSDEEAFPWLSDKKHRSRHYIWWPWFFTLTIDLHITNQFLMCILVFFILFSVNLIPNTHMFLSISTDQNVFTGSHTKLKI